jgi:hypothetical protein
MQKALIALDSLEGGPGSWTFGGGTALAQILAHRISYDVDIFLDSSTVLKNLAPNINPVTKSLCDTWQCLREIPVLATDCLERLRRNGKDDVVGFGFHLLAGFG